MANLITGDAVTLDLRVAGLPSRSLALALDLAVQFALLLGGSVLIGWVFAQGGSPGAQAAVTLVTAVLALVGWPALIETLTRGRSPGKILMGLRVVRDDGGPTRFRHSLVRALAMVFLDFWVTSGVVGGLSALLSAKSKRMGDHLAGTIVVGERIPRTARRYQDIAMPPPLAGWAAGLDLVAVPDALALNIRTFLHRADSLDPRVRQSTAHRLATELSAHVRAPAPPGTPAEAYLMAVLAERTRRAYPGPTQPGPPGPPQSGSPSPTAGPARNGTPASPEPAAPPSPGGNHPQGPEAPPGFTLPR